MLIHRQRGWLRSRSSGEAKPHLIGWRGAAAKLTARCDNTGQSDGLPRAWLVSFYSVIDFLYYSSTTKLIPSLILIKESYPSSKASLLCRESSSAL